MELRANREKIAVFALLLALGAVGAYAPGPEAFAAPKKKETPVPEPSSTPTPVEPSRLRAALGRLRIEAWASGGFSRPSFVIYQASPFQVHWGVGAGVAYPLPRIPRTPQALEIFAGLSTDYRFVAQYSEIVEKVGNTRGTRWNAISPLVVVSWDKKFFLRGEFEFLGSYKLSLPTVEGAKLSYLAPLGWRATGLYNVGRHFKKEGLLSGVLVENVSFSKQEYSTAGAKSMEFPVSVLQIGLVLAYVF